jgi:hypothetical protein
MFLVLVYRYGLGLVFLLGFTGNLASIATFMRPTLRSTSTGCLFLMVAVSDTVFLLVSIFDFVEVGLVQGPIFLEIYDDLCRFRWYTKGLGQFCSAWLLVFIAIDRWLKARFPFKTSKWCRRRNAFIMVLLAVVIGCCLHSHMLNAQVFGKRFPGIATEACGPIDYRSSYTEFYFATWSYIQAVLVCIVPATLMLISAIDISHVIRKGKMRIQPAGRNQANLQRRDRIQRQVLLMMISSIILFLLTVLPVNIRVIVATYQITMHYVVDLTEIANQTAIISVFLTLNYAVSNKTLMTIQSNRRSLIIAS